MRTYLIDILHTTTSYMCTFIDSFHGYRMWDAELRHLTEGCQSRMDIAPSQNNTMTIKYLNTNKLALGVRQLGPVLHYSCFKFQKT